MATATSILTAEQYMALPDAFDGPTVCVLEDQTKTIHAFHADGDPQKSELTDEFTLPQILSDFRVPVRRFFE